MMSSNKMKLITFSNSSSDLVSVLLECNSNEIKKLRTCFMTTIEIFEKFEIGYSKLLGKSGL